MSQFERCYEDGEVIFREGEKSRSAFVIVSGGVELLKKNRRKQVRIALLSAGEMFGEMGIVDNSQRSATARAIGDVVLDAVEKRDFLASLKSRPDMALTVIGNLAERLRDTNERVIVRKPAAADGERRRSFSVENILNAFFANRAARERSLEIRVVRLARDEDGAETARVVEALTGHKGVRAAALDEVVEMRQADDAPTPLIAEARAARQLLSGEKADLLIWGSLNEIRTAMELRFVSETPMEDHQGGFLISDRLCLPLDFPADYDPLLTAVALAATTPRTEFIRRIQKGHLLPTLELAQEQGANPPVELSLTDQASLQVCYGNVAALIGYQANDPNWYRRAAQAYQGALEIITEDEAQLDWATVQHHLGRVLQAIGERASDDEILVNAAEAYRAALKAFTQASFPWEWASLQSRLGMTLYKLDLIRGDTEILKHAVGAFQAALQVFTRANAPYRWSEVKNSLGQALQVWGDLARNTELLERAALCCQEALQVRTRHDTPLQWAASQNNLGSALFLLGKLTKDSEHLEGAAEAFGGALEIYQAQGAARLAHVTERNMAKAEDLLRARLARRVAKVYWEDEANERRARSLEKMLRRKTAADGV